MTTSQSETQRTKKETKRGHTGQSQCPLKKNGLSQALLVEQIILNMEAVPLTTKSQLTLSSKEMAMENIFI